MSICATSLLQTTGNESTVSNYKSDNPYYIGEHLGHLKDFEIFKYQRESNIGTRFVDPPPPLLIFFNSSLLWDVFIINSVEQLYRSRIEFLVMFEVVQHCL